MQSTYKAFVDRMIQRYEGGYCWDKGDAGGPTKYGITCFDLAEHRHQKMSSMSTWAPIVRAMTLAEAEDIYRIKYAGHVHYNELPAGVDACMMDYAVNSGIGRPVRVARALLKLPGGTNMDDALLKAIQRVDPKWLITNMNRERLRFLHGLHNYPTFGKGWNSRVKDLDAYCLHLAGSGPAPSGAAVVPTPAPKATNTVPDTGTKIGTGAGGAIVTSYPMLSEHIWLFLGLALLILVTAGVTVYLMHRRTDAANAAVSIPADVGEPPVV